MTDSPSPSGRRRYWKVVRFGIFSSVIIPVILGAVVALFYARIQPVQYTAHATVRVDSLVTLASGGSLQAKLPDMPTEQQIAASAAVAKLARSALEPSTPSVTYLLKHLKVTTAGTGNVLVINYTSSSAKLAARYANAFAQAYVTYRNAPLNRLILSTKRDIALLKGQNPHDGVILRVAAAAQLRADETLLRQLETAAKLSPGGLVIAGAIPPGSPSSAKTARDLALGLAAGLVAGFCLALQRVAYRYLERHHSPM
jgi:polysaccharide biosynthesis transport protein